MREAPSPSQALRRADVHLVELDRFANRLQAPGPDEDLVLLVESGVAVTAQTCA